VSGCTEKTHMRSNSKSMQCHCRNLFIYMLLIELFFLICTQYEEPMSYTEITITFFSLQVYFQFNSVTHISTHSFSQRPLITNDFELYLSHYNVHSFLSFLDIVKSFNISFLHSLFSLLAFVKGIITMATH